MDSVDARLIDLLQPGIPITERPFCDVAEQLGIAEQDVVDRTRRLLAEGVLTRFGPLFNADALGGGYSLCALAVPTADFERVTAQVNAHDEVAHNYEREHALNMWFVIAAEHPWQIQQVIDRIETETGFEVYNFPKQREYCVELQLAAERPRG